MKFVILAATIGHVFGAATGAACRARTVTGVTADPAADVAYEGRCDADTEGGTTTCQAATNAANTDEGCGLADTVVVETNAATIAVGAVGGACRASATASATAGSITAAVTQVDAIACDTTGDTCVGEVTTAGSEADGACITDGATGGVCLAAVTAVGACDTDVTISTDGTYCAADANGATALGTSGEAVGADGGAPRTGDAIIAAVAGDDRCTGALVATITDDAASPPVETGCTCAAAVVETAADGADTGACRAVVAADATADPPVVAVTACDDALVCTGFVAAVEGVTADDTADPPVVAVTAVTGVAGTCGAATTDTDSPAAIFYGMSMVTAAIAYLL